MIVVVSRTIIQQAGTGGQAGLCLTYAPARRSGLFALVRRRVRRGILSTIVSSPNRPKKGHPMPNRMIDSVVGLEVDTDKYFNHCQSLGMLSIGLFHLVSWVRGREARFAELNKTFTWTAFGPGTGDSSESLAYTACVFHWFGSSIFNYARLVGYIRGADSGAFTSADFGTEKGCRKVSRSVND